MQGTTVVSSLDTAMLMAPFAIFMVLAMFGLDAQLAADKKRKGRRRFCEVRSDGHGLLTDPHGSRR